MNAEQIKNLSIEFSEKPLEEKTVMFIENYYNGARGVISKMFKTYLSGPLYKDYRFVWFARDYEETIRIFGSLLDDSRIWICVANGHDYVRFLNTAKYIVTAAYLPNFFIKREEQVVYYALLDFFINKRIYTNAMLWRLCPTMNNADHILFESESKEIYDFSDRFGINEKIKFLDLDIPQERKNEKKSVFLSLMDKKRAIKSLGIFQYVYDTITSLAAAYGYEVYWKIGVDLFRKYREDEMLLLAFENIYSGEDNCREYLESADIVITDNYTDVLSSDKYCEDVIFYYNESIDYEALITRGEVMVTSDYGRLLDIFEMKLEGRDTIEDTVNMDFVPVLLDCPEELCGDCGYLVTEGRSLEKYDVHAEKDNRDRVLILLETEGVEDMVTSLCNMLGEYKERMNITVLFCTAAGGKLYEHLDEMITDFSFVCRVGAIRCTPRDRKEVIKKIDWEKDPTKAKRAEKVLREEWMRIIGKTTYDQAVAMSGINNFWDNMNRFIPAKEVSFFDKNKSVEEIIRDIQKVLTTAYINETITNSE